MCQPRPKGSVFLGSQPVLQLLFPPVKGVSVVCAQQTSRQAMLFHSFFSPFEMGFCFVSEANFELLDTSDSSSPKNWYDRHEHCVYTSCVLVVKSTSFELDFLSAHLKMFRAVLTVSMFFRMFSGASFNRNFASIFQAFWTEADSPICHVLPILPLCESLPVSASFQQSQPALDLPLASWKANASEVNTAVLTEPEACIFSLIDYCQHLVNT